MPELPEVETVRRQLEPVLVGRRISDAWGFGADNFRRAVDASDALVTSARRRGKYLLFGLSSDGTGDDRELVVHLGMTGRLAVAPPEGVPTGNSAEHLRAWWSLDSGDPAGERLWMWDVRRFGRVAVVEPGAYADLPTLAALGPEPLSAEFTGSGLRSSLSGRKAIKTALLDQRAVAGVGNIYADEALWMARVSPFARRVSTERAQRLRDALVDVLTAAVANGGTTLRDYRQVSGETGTHQFRLRCYGRAGEPCLRCGVPLSHTVLDGRGTTWCRRCQR